MRIESRSVSPGARAAFAGTPVRPVSGAITTPAPVTGATSGTSLDHWGELGARVPHRALSITMGTGNESPRLVRVSPTRVMSRNTGALVTVTRQVSATVPDVAMTRAVPAPTAMASGPVVVSSRTTVGSGVRHASAGFWITLPRLFRTGTVRRSVSLRLASVAVLGCTTTEAARSP